MRKILILGSGTAGTIMANRLHAVLPRERWRITVVDNDPNHYYQPGFLFLPFGIYSRTDVVEAKSKYIPADIEFIITKIEVIEAASNRVKLFDGKYINYDYLIIATGTQVHPEETEGMLGPGWGKDVHEFYTLDGALALTEALRGWEGGRLVMNIVEIPIKCPVAPLEFVFLADWWLRKHGLRERTEISYVTPLDGAFTRPIASRILGETLERKKIKLVPEFSIGTVDQEGKKIVDWGGQELGYDMLVTVPTNMGDSLMARSELGNELNYVPTQRRTLRSRDHANIFVIGDATDLPTSKAGSVAHFAAEVLTQNILREIKGEPLEESFDGHANCFIESGDNRGILIDFNYDTEPLAGVFPWPWMGGPFHLLEETRMNHLAKMWFRWVYWNVLLKGRYIPISAKMSLASKIKPTPDPGAV
jgi:sulfide:quinone oxidoreductase